MNGLKSISFLITCIIQTCRKLSKTTEFLNQLQTLMEMEQIPVVDIENLNDILQSENPKGEQKWIALSKNVRKILGEIGFMQLIHHGIPDKVVANVFEQSEKFFQLSDKIKIKYKKPEFKGIESYYGYTRPGQENLTLQGKPTLEFRETYDWVEGKGTYPDEELPEFEKCIDTLHECCKVLMKKLLRLLAIGLDLDDTDFFIKKHQHWIDPKKFTGMTNIRLAHYPKIDDELEIPKGSVRIAEHTDYITLTLLFQDDVGGLEAKNSNGDWVNVKPIPGAIVCNTGDLLEFWTTGLFCATAHRVLIPDSEIKKRQPRYSIAYFSGPDSTEIVTPLEIKKSEEEASRLIKNKKSYPTGSVNVLEHVMGKATTSYDNTYLKLKQT